MKHEPKLIGKVVTIKDAGSIYFGEWGTIEAIDDDGYYFVAIAGDKTAMPIFTRDQIKVRRA